MNSYPVMLWNRINYLSIQYLTMVRKLLHFPTIQKIQRHSIHHMIKQKQAVTGKFIALYELRSFIDPESSVVF